MLKLFKKVILAILPKELLRSLRERLGKNELKKWKENGSPLPPPHYAKQLVLRAYQKQFGHTILIETGTYQGDMVEAQLPFFEEIYSIELSQVLFGKATERFKKEPKVHIIQGDSGKVLPELMSTIKKTALFWLDGHYSGGVTAKAETECPIYEEIDAIFLNKNGNHTLLIDDARLFNGQNDYPTIEDLTKYIQQKNDKYTVEVKDDILRYTL